jgi:hypothetical protein
MTEPGHQDQRPADRTARDGAAVAMSEGDPSPAAPRRGLRRRWPLLALGGAVAAAAAITVAIVPGGSPGTGSPAAAYLIVAPPAAAGWKITEAGPGGATLSLLEASPLMQHFYGVAGRTAAGIYFDPASGASPDSAASVVFGGASGSLGDPAGLIARLRADPGQAVSRPGVVAGWHEVDPGPHGGRAACGDVTYLSPPARVPFCTWQTPTSWGELSQLPATPVSGVLTTDGLASLMRRMRADLEVAP